MNTPQVVRNAVLAEHSIFPLVIIAENTQVTSALFAVDHNLYLLTYILALLRHLFFGPLSPSPCVSILQPDDARCPRRIPLQTSCLVHTLFAGDKCGNSGLKVSVSHASWKNGSADTRCFAVTLYSQAKPPRCVPEPALSGQS